MNAEASDHLKRGQACFFAEPPDFARAEECFLRVTQSAPRWIEGNHWLASAQERLQKPGEAIKSYRKATECDPTDPRPRLCLGTLLLKLGHLEEGIAELERGIALKPHYGEADARLSLADAYAKDGRMAKARAQWEVVAGMRPSYPSGDEPVNEARRRLGQRSARGSPCPRPQ
jgi:predicted Zn-dependent protease